MKFLVTFLHSPVVQITHAPVYLGEEFELNTFFQLSHVTCLLYEFASILCCIFLSLLQPAANLGPTATYYSCSGKFSFMILANPEEVSR